MDLNAIKKRLNEFQKQAQNSSGGQQKQLFWNPWGPVRSQEGSQEVRTYILMVYKHPIPVNP